MWHLVVQIFHSASIRKISKYAKNNSGFLYHGNFLNKTTMHNKGMDSDSSTNLTKQILMLVSTCTQVNAHEHLFVDELSIPCTIALSLIFGKLRNPVCDLKNLHLITQKQNTLILIPQISRPNLLKHMFLINFTTFNAILYKLVDVTEDLIL